MKGPDKAGCQDITHKPSEAYELLQDLSYITSAIPFQSAFPLHRIYSGTFSVLKSLICRLLARKYGVSYLAAECYRWTRGT